MLINKEEAIVIISTSWGTKHGGINSFSTKLVKALDTVIQDVIIINIVPSATDEDIQDAKASNVRLETLCVVQDQNVICFNLHVSNKFAST